VSVEPATGAVAARTLLRAALLGLLACAAAPASAWVLTLTPGTKQLFLMVGNGTAAASNTTINTVSVTVPSASVGNGTAVTMTSNSTQSTSPYDNYAVCNSPAQIYVGGSYRQPTSTTGSAAATLVVTTPTSLTNGSYSLAFSQISWTSSANGDTTANIAAGTFNGGSVSLASIARNTFVENCFTYSYANSAVVPAGTYTGRAVFTLTVP